MKIATFNISGGFYAGESIEYLERAAAKTVDDKLHNDIVEIIKNEKLDLIAFQEIITTPEIGYIKRIIDATELKHVIDFELSECNLVEGTKCGLAILSRCPIKNVRRMLFPNPRLSKTTSSGNTYYSYDKGMIICDIKSRRFLVHHNFPFRRFGSAPHDNREVFDFLDAQIKKYMPDVVMGDFNTNDFVKLVPSLATAYRPTYNEETTVDHERYDNILVRKKKPAETYAIKSFSDHYCLISDIK